MPIYQPPQALALIARQYLELSEQIRLTQIEINEFVLAHQSELLEENEVLQTLLLRLQNAKIGYENAGFHLRNDLLPFIGRTFYLVIDQKVWYFGLYGFPGGSHLKIEDIP